MDQSLIVITGASKGLGLSLSKIFLEDAESPNRITVINLSRSNSPLVHKNLVNCNIDLVNVLELEKTLADILNSYKDQTWSSVTLVNNAATISPVSSVAELAPGELISATNINYIAPVILIKVFLSVFSEHNLKLVNISSGAADANISGWAIYSSLKAAINRFTENADDEYGERGRIKFMIFNPGIMDTSMQDEIRNSDFRDRSRFVEFKEHGRLRPPAVVAQHLASLLLQDRFDLYESM